LGRGDPEVVRWMMVWGISLRGVYDSAISGSDDADNNDDDGLFSLPGTPLQDYTTHFTPHFTPSIPSLLKILTDIKLIRSVLLCLSPHSVVLEVAEWCFLI